MENFKIENLTFANQESDAKKIFILNLIKNSIESAIEVNADNHFIEHILSCFNKITQVSFDLTIKKVTYKCNNKTNQTIQLPLIFNGNSGNFIMQDAIRTIMFSTVIQKELDKFDRIISNNVKVVEIIEEKTLLGIDFYYNNMKIIIYNEIEHTLKRVSSNDSKLNIIINHTIEILKRRFKL